MNVFDISPLLSDLKTKSAKRKFLSSQVGTLSTPSKMPGYAYSIPAQDCITGSKLRKVENSVCSFCYALKGRYLFPNVFNAMTLRLNAVINNRYWHVYMKELIALESGEKIDVFRWHDSGDLQSLKHLKQIVWIAEELPGMKFWLPTRENGIVKRFLAKYKCPDNLCIRVSNHMMDSHKSASSFPNRSAVVTDVSLAKDGPVCPATLPTSDKKCGSCRNCWDKSVNTVNYLAH